MRVVREKKKEGKGVKTDSQLAVMTVVNTTPFLVHV